MRISQVFRFTYVLLLFCTISIQAKLPEITPEIAHAKLEEIMKSHASHHQLTPVLIKRVLANYMEELDPTKTYFIESDISAWMHPSDAQAEQILVDYQNRHFSVFEQIQKTMTDAIHRRRLLDQKVDTQNLPTHVNPEEFKDMKWVKNEDELLTRLSRIKALQIESAAKLTNELKEKSLQRIKKRQEKYEEEILNSNPEELKKRVLTTFLKASASALDSHTAYFTPDEATEFMINVQQRLLGIGAQLRDDLNGFTVVKIIEGGPASLGKELKAKDRIIAVDGEPVVGMDITNAVELIRGHEGTPVILTVIRESNDNGHPMEQKLDIPILRGEVVLKETRYEASHDPFGNGVIGYLRLYSFYQDPDSASATDLENEIKKMKKDHKLQGIILDLRYNSGGMLSQAVNVTGLFITKGVVVTIKDSAGKVQHLRNLETKTTWDGPLIVLTNRASASASEIVAQTLQDYGRAIVVGDDHSYGKGSFQTFTLNSNAVDSVNPQGEYKVTRGRYYTVSGKTPQLNGVYADIVVPGALSESEIGEKFAKFPLESDQIKENFDDDLADIPFAQRAKIRMLYKFDLQPKLNIYNKYLETLKTNSAYRIEHNKNFQAFLKDLKKKEKEKDSIPNEEEEESSFGQNDLQLTETYNIMKDLILIMTNKP
ncbi:S41 family peptidase [Parachlamydia acanthamoebae]|uniref:tail-specific protease Tsp n=1 Tax=Parachlamydia acanthamoebae TaxID=83552 RepID=UPI0024E1C453|nr:S41 family peptidase [Parachlamydia acanthamoebae]